MRSMTGFGSGEAPLGAGRLCAEIRALNHRTVEVRVRVPPELSEHAVFVEQLVRERLGRGRYDVNVRAEGAALEAPSVSLEHARAAWTALQRLADELRPGEAVPVAAVAAVPGVLVPATPDAEGARACLRRALELAFVRLDAMRKSEGDALGRDLAERLTTARRLRDEIAARAPELLGEWRSKLKERVERLSSEIAARLDAGRLELEVALIAERADVAEELTRLDSHFDQIAALLASTEPVGRRLDFLLQEIGRETNTLGSKSQDVAISHRVVALKAEIERMREQVQNVE